MTPPGRAAQGSQPGTRRLGSAAWRRLAWMAAAGTLAAGTGVLTAALLVPAAASASSSQTWTGGGDGTSWSDGMKSFSVLLYHARGGMFGSSTGTPAHTVTYTATAANVVYP